MSKKKERCEYCEFETKAGYMSEIVEKKTGDNFYLCSECLKIYDDWPAAMYQTITGLGD